MGGFNLEDKDRNKYRNKIDKILPLRTTSRLINCEDRYLKDDPRKLHRSMRSVELLVELTLDLNEMADSKIIDLRNYISKSGKDISSPITPEKIHELALKVREMYLSQEAEIKMIDRMIKNNLHLHITATIGRIKDLKCEPQDSQNLDDTKETIKQLENQFRILLRLRKSVGQDLVWKKIANHLLNYAYLTNLLKNP